MKVSCACRHSDLSSFPYEILQARGLADKVADDPPTIQLKFEHKATDQLNGDDFYTHSKENRCAPVLPNLLALWLQQHKLNTPLDTGLISAA